MARAVILGAIVAAVLAAVALDRLLSKNQYLQLAGP
jgi:hypothetical protein